MLERKYAVIHIRRCPSCALMFRWPKDDAADNFDYYQRAYQDRGITALPDASALASLKTSNFSGGALDYSKRIQMIQALRPGGSLLDFGASWGYNVHQFRAAGYEAVGCEISAPRADYGRTGFGIRIEASSAVFPNQSFDIIHSSHVLEHVPDLNVPFAEFARLLAPDGLLIIFVPNAGGLSARTQGVKWEPLIGEKHILALNAEFFARNLRKYGFSLEFASSPYLIAPRALDKNPGLDGGELLVIGRVRRPLA